MLRFFIAVLFFSISFTASAQIVKVLDKTTLQPLPNVNIYTTDNQLMTFTDVKGQADISPFKSRDSIIIQFVGYQQRLLSYSELSRMKWDVLMSEKSHSLDEVVVSASKFEEKKSDIPQQIEIIDAKELSFINQPTTAEVLMQSGNVLVQKSQMGGGSPILRGFEANKVLLVIDGVRMNNAIYRGGHLQNSITVDNSMLKKMEIVFGPGSVVYGSDALGGVIHFHTKDPLLAGMTNKSLTRVNTYTRYATASDEKTGHVDFNLGFEKIGFLTSISFSDFDDLRQGNIRNPFYGDFGKRYYFADRVNGTDTMITNENINIQSPSGYSQWDVLQKILYQQSTKVSHVLNIQYSNTTDVPRYDRLSEIRDGILRYAEWYYGPQERLLAAYSLNLLDGKFYDHAKLIAAYQDITESRHTRRFGNDILTNRVENLDIYTINIDFDKVLGRHELRYGFEGLYNYVNSDANDENIVTNEISPADTRYPDGGSDMRSVAGYITHTWEISPIFILSDGIRYSNISLNAYFDDKSFFPFPFAEVHQQFGAFTGNIGLVMQPGNDWRFSVLASSGFRSPNIDDLGKIFESVPGNVIVPNPDLKPEYTYNAEFGISKVLKDAIAISGTAFYTIYDNAITTIPYTMNGEDSILYDGVLSMVTANANAGEAYIYGFSGNIKGDITEAISFYTSLNYTYGRIRTDSTEIPLDHIPPLYGKTGVKLTIRKFKGEFFALYNGWKRIEDYNPLGEDNQKYATEWGMPSWYTLNVRTAYQLNKYLRLQVDLENILDKNYRVFASGIHAPGRNLILTARATF